MGHHGALHQGHGHGGSGHRQEQDKSRACCTLRRGGAEEGEGTEVWICRGMNTEATARAQGQGQGVGQGSEHSNEDGQRETGGGRSMEGAVGRDRSQTQGDKGRKDWLP